MSDEELDFGNVTMRSSKNESSSSINVCIIKRGQKISVDSEVYISDDTQRKSGRLDGYRLWEAIEIAISQLEMIKEVLKEKHI